MKVKNVIESKIVSIVPSEITNIYRTIIDHNGVIELSIATQNQYIDILASDCNKLNLFPGREDYLSTLKGRFLCNMEIIGNTLSITTSSKEGGCEVVKHISLKTAKVEVDIMPRYEETKRFNWYIPSPKGELVGPLRKGNWDFFKIETPQDNVNSPTHYQSKSGKEVIDIIEDFDLNFNRGSALKYTIRAGKKKGAPEIEDLRKGIKCLEREIARLADANR